MYGASGSCEAEVKCKAADVAGKTLPQANMQYATALICFTNGHIQCLFQTKKRVVKGEILY